jgi:hypothetical protein
VVWLVKDSHLTMGVWGRQAKPGGDVENICLRVSLLIERFLTCMPSTPRKFESLLDSASL